ncbi:putative hemoglobin and hemoglobin-haptoglobin-binding protein 3 [Trachymyrmex septentrionalis]|uniref:Putative hemoglobin and hemoglobin-haptoglobin-binding protein 3 n=1 Tax=Trachymyrmex septentrionalis TaxID=34720 RepID=A0A195FHG6_9HYME|nr:putative hemoglobin and hemoglobin-haptoglobin-binding protein 3 [Trachymyrmex septentrionalis]
MSIEETNVYRSDKTEVQNDKEKEQKRDEKKGACETRRDSQGCGKGGQGVQPTTDRPTDRPTDQPTNQPTNQPTSQPTNQPTNQPKSGIKLN